LPTKILSLREGLGWLGTFSDLKGELLAVFVNLSIATEIYY
jgi:hypothetical protein